MMTIKYPSLSKKDKEQVQDKILDYMEKNKIFPSLTGILGDNYCSVPKDKQQGFKAFVEALKV